MLIGHSFAGLEMSNVASRHPERIAAVVYLDATHSWDADYEARGFYKIVQWKEQLNRQAEVHHRARAGPRHPCRHK